MEKLKLVGKCAVPAVLVLLPLVALAQGPVFNQPIPALSGTPITLNEVQDLITGIARFLIIISILVAVIFIVWGGIRWVSAGADPKGAAAGKSIIVNGIIGALIILAVGVIINTLAGVVSRGFFGTYNQ